MLSFHGLLRVTLVEFLPGPPFHLAVLSSRLSALFSSVRPSVRPSVLLGSGLLVEFIRNALLVAPHSLNPAAVTSNFFSKNEVRKLGIFHVVSNVSFALNGIFKKSLKLPEIRVRKKSVSMQKLKVRERNAEHCVNQRFMQRLPRKNPSLSFSSLVFLISLVNI